MEIKILRAIVFFVGWIAISCCGFACGSDAADNEYYKTDKKSTIPIIISTAILWLMEWYFVFS